MRCRPGPAWLALALLLAACATRPPALDLGGWRAPQGRRHPLTGRAWDVAARRFVAPDALVTRLAGARYVLLGERHDNPDHHRLQAALLGALIEAGRRPAVAFEMFTLDDAPAIARHLAVAPRDARGLADAVDWQRSGWPDWAYYEPIAQAALDAGLPIVAANLAPATARALARGQPAALPDALAARYGLDRPLPGGAQAALTEEISRAHCGHLPSERVESMVRAQRARDAMLADRMLSGGGDGAVLIAGAGHVRADLGVPLYLRARVPDGAVAAVAALEVEDGRTAPADYAVDFGGRLPFDWVVFTPAMARADPCGRLRARTS